MNKWKPNTTQQAVINFLSENKGKEYSLNEISQALNIEKVQTGTTNILVKKGLISINKDSKTIVCACCGHKKVVSTYFIK